MEEEEIDTEHKSIARRPYVIGLALLAIVIVMINFSRYQERKRLAQLWAPKCRENPQCLQNLTPISDRCFDRVRVFKPKTYNIKSDKDRYVGCVKGGVWQAAEFKLEEPAGLSIKYAVGLFPQ